MSERDPEAHETEAPADPVPAESPDGQAADPTELSSTADTTIEDEDEDEVEREPTADQRRDALVDLKRAEVVEEATSAEVTDLYIRAWVRTGGVPARIVSNGETAAHLPDATASREGRHIIERLDAIVAEGIEPDPDADSGGAVPSGGS